MKKIYVAAALFAMGAATSNAQTLLVEDFQGDLTNIQVAYPTTPYTDWYTFDEDGLPDGSPSSRPEEWFLGYAFAIADSLTPGGDTNFVLCANSWVVGGQAMNWLVSPQVTLPAGTGTLKWKSASFQTPYYLDGYKVMISTTDNDLTSFTTDLYTAGEYTAGDLTQGQAGNYSSYTFAPAGAWTQGISGGSIVMSEVEDNDGDLARYTGVLTEKTIDLSAYAGQSVFIAFLHNSYDDNLISVDDIRIDWVVGVNENESMLSKVTAYPNPTTDMITLQFEMSNASPVIMTITDVKGRIVATESLGIVSTGVNKKDVDVSGYAAGTYNVQLRTDRGVKSMSFVKK